MTASFRIAHLKSRRKRRRFFLPQKERLKKPLNIGIITPPIGSAGVFPLSNLIDIISYISNLNYVITGEVKIKPTKIRGRSISIYKIRYFPKSNIIKKIISNIYLQIQISNKQIELRNKADVLVYFLDSHVYLLSVFIGIMLKKKVAFVLAASISDSSRANPSIFSKVLRFSEFINFKCANCIILYSPRLIEKWNLGNYAHKILIAHRHFFDFKIFTVTTPLNDRPSLIGYIGRLSEEKGVQHFAEALPTILGGQQNLRVIIGGDGQLMDTIGASLQMKSIAARVDLPGWIDHDDLPRYLNKLRLLVLPSYTEGLPNIMLEAMACGTPVLATPVGAIPDVIIDGKTGFIMESNSPECIAENVMRALEHPDLEGVAQRARTLVEREFTFERAVERWSKVLVKVGDDKR